MNERYSRQILLKEIGNEGQEKLGKAHVAVVGCGGLGAIASMYLAGAGVGAMTLIDGDRPDLSNVHRQVFYTGSESESKATVLQRKISTLNPEVKIQTLDAFLTKENIDEALTGIDLILECTDDIMCKYLVNDYATLESITLVYGAIHKYEGYVSVFKNEVENDIHLRDIFPYPDETIPTCSEVGVLNTIAGLIGMLQANEAMKHILGIGNTLVEKLLTYDCMTNRQYILNTNKTWTLDMADTWDENSYLPMDCSFVKEIDTNSVSKDRSRFQVISILPIAEHQAIDDAVVHLPKLASDFSQLGEIKKPIILYCRTGNKSKKLAAKIMNVYPNIEIYSMKGGLKEYIKHHGTL